MYVDVLTKATVSPWKAIEHLLGLDSVVEEEVQTKQSDFDDGAGNQLSDWTYLEQPVTADLLGRFRDVTALEVLYAELVDLLFSVVGETQAFDPFEDTCSKLFDYLHQVGEFESMKLLGQRWTTPFEVSCSSLQDWMAIWRLPTLSFVFHFPRMSFFMFWRIWM